MTGPLYHAALSQLGATVFDRSHQPENDFSTPAHMELFDFDTLVMPEYTKPGKGVGLGRDYTRFALCQGQVRYGKSGTRTVAYVDA